MARTVTDVAAMLGAMTGIDSNDLATQVTAGKAPIHYTQYVESQRAAGMRVGIVTMDEAAIETLAARWAEWMEEPESVEKVRNEIRLWDERMHEQAKTLAALGIEMVKVPAAAIPPEPPMMKVIDYSFRDALNRFLQALGDEAPIKSLAEIVAINSQDLDNRAPYGQGHLVSAQNCVMTAEEYAVEAEAQQAVRERLGALFTEYQLDALLSRSYVYAAAGFPALSVPSGYDEKGQPYDLKLLGDFLGEDRLLTIGYAYEQATRARVAPDLERTVAAIEALSAR